MTLQGENTYPAPSASLADALGVARYAADGHLEARLPFGLALLLGGLLSLGLWAGLFGLISAAFS